MPQDANQAGNEAVKVEKVESSSVNTSSAESKDETKPLFVVTKNNIWKISSGILAIFLIVALVFLFKSGSDIPTGAVVQQPGAAAQPSAANPTAAPAQGSVLQVSVDDDAIKGDKNAKVTIVEFSDYQCPFCGRFFRDTLPQVEEQYVKTGKVKMVFRDFPLSFHENAQKAGEAAECAGDQDKYWEMHDKLFQNQQKLAVSDLKQYAVDLKLDTKAFNDCLDSSKYKAEMQKDMADGSSYGVSGTPAFFINGRKLVGAQPFSAFKSIIDAELAK
ncbi:DsbA family protein [Candidatus Woesearchaeota archaeon]|nr:DsbA family protein [Candidatus Woesearchaeota archaeon]